MIIRRAAQADMPRIMALVDSVFSGEQGIPQQMNPVPDERQPQWWCAVEENEIVGTAVLYAQAGEWRIGRLAVARPLRGRRIGTQLLREALTGAFAQGADAVHMEARDAMVRILLRMGAEISGEPFEFYCGAVTPVIMRKAKYRE